MKLNLTVDLFVATVTVLLSAMVFVDHCSARLRPLASSASLSKVGNLAADHLSALQKTSRKVTKSSVVGINWKNVLLLAGLKAGLVGAGLIKKKVAYKKLKGLKSIEGFDHLNYLGGYALGGYQPAWNGGHFDDKFVPQFTGSKFVAQQTSPPYFFDPPPEPIGDWPTKQQPSQRLHTDKYPFDYSPVIWRKSSLCGGLNHCADYLTSPSVTYQLLGPSLPMHLSLLQPASSSPARISSSPHLHPQSNQPLVWTWVNAPPLVTDAHFASQFGTDYGGTESTGAHSGVGSLGSSISQTIGSLRSTLSSLSNSISSNPKITNNNSNNLNNSNNPPKQIEQEKEDEKYPHGEPHAENHVEPNHSTQFTSANASQYIQPPANDHPNSLQFKEPSETPSEQLVENSNKISPPWSA